MPAERSAFGHVGLCVPDIDAAVRFYVDALGLEVVAAPFAIAADAAGGDAAADVFGPRFAAARQAHLVTADGIGLELFQFLDPPVEPSRPSYWRAGVSHLCFVVRDLEATEERIRAAGGRIRTSRIWSSFPGRPYRFGHGEDPFGNLIELHSHRYERTFSNQDAPDAR